MDLYAGNTYWNQTQPATSQFEKLKQDIHTDVLIVGAGISGTLCANVLSTRGLDVVVVEKNRLPMEAVWLTQGCYNTVVTRVSVSLQKIFAKKRQCFFIRCVWKQWTS